MFSSFIAKRVVDRVYCGTPKIDENKCINNTKKGVSCTRCVDVCKQSVFEHSKIFRERCINCNLCSVSCPTQAIYPSSAMMMEVDETVRCRESRLVVGCHLDGEKKDIGVWCFASLPWEIYALMALKNRKVITNAQCKSCVFFDDMKTRMDEIQKTIGREKFNECFEFNDQSSGKQFTRREALGYFRREGDKTTKNIVLNHVKKTDGLYYRKYLMNHLGKNTKLFWEIPAFNRACWGCGICISVCPNEALVKLNDNTLAFVPWRCTRCKLCQKYCPERAMDNWQYKEVTLLGNDKMVVMDNLVPCPDCERAMKPMDGKYFCYYCGYEKAMEEATKRISEANVRNRIV